ncbi:TetR/AcrR family transcriptional regulator [Nocardia sp. NPDC050697]|uniref:TetR/AcrR family transcriptional regulator n=1 Tax=Nocardia sp. NPDC050697 TaxID=3155158 RepID=UPI0033CCB69E
MPLERIVDAAISLVDEQGAEALSMRSLAKRLDSGTATLYRHFGSRAQLVDHVVDAVLGGIDLDGGAAAPSATWQQSCATAAHAMFDTLARHPNVATLLTERIPVGSNAMRQREFMINTLLAAGFDPALAARAYATLARYVLGFAIQIGASAGAESLPSPADAPPGRHPATAAVAAYLPVPLASEFGFGLDLILEGLTGLLARTADRSGRQAP